MAQFHLFISLAHQSSPPCSLSPQERVNHAWTLQLHVVVDPFVPGDDGESGPDSVDASREGRQQQPRDDPPSTTTAALLRRRFGAGIERVCLLQHPLRRRRRSRCGGLFGRRGKLSPVRHSPLAAAAAAAATTTATTTNTSAAASGELPPVGDPPRCSPSLFLNGGHFDRGVVCGSTGGGVGRPLAQTP